MFPRWSLPGSTSPTTAPSTDEDADPSRDAELGELVVDPEARGVGHGSRLLHAAVDTMRSDKFSRALTWVPTTSAASPLAAWRDSAIVVSDGTRSLTVDRIVSATGFRPDHTIVSELRLDLDPILGSTRALAPLIDPNEHSCGTVPPHGVDELAQPEPGYYAIGSKAYGRAPTFLLATGYEQARSVVAALAGDWEAARDVQLDLPETGVCNSNPVVGDEAIDTLDAVGAAGGACCGTPAAETVPAGRGLATAISGGLLSTPLTLIAAATPAGEQPGGCCTWLPYFNEDLVELPITLAQDYTLFTILRHEDERLWIEKAHFLREHGGMALLITHPDYMLERRPRAAYARFLDAFREDRTVWQALPREVSAWWRRRAASHLERSGQGWKIVGPAAEDGRIVDR